MKTIPYLEIQTGLINDDKRSKKYKDVKEIPMVTNSKIIFCGEDVSSKIDFITLNLRAGEVVNWTLGINGAKGGIAKYGMGKTTWLHNLLHRIK